MIYMRHPWVGSMGPFALFYFILFILWQINCPAQVINASGQTDSLAGDCTNEYISWRANCLYCTGSRVVTLSPPSSSSSSVSLRLGCGWGINGDPHLERAYSEVIEGDCCRCTYGRVELLLVRMADGLRGAKEKNKSGMHRLSIYYWQTNCTSTFIVWASNAIPTQAITCRHSLARHNSHLTSPPRLATRDCPFWMTKPRSVGGNLLIISWAWMYVYHPR